MAWTTPKTWAVDEFVTPALMNSHLRDNSLMMWNDYVTTLPASPFDGQWAILVDSLTAPTYSWQMRYNAAFLKWEFMGGRAAFSEVTTSGTTASTTYTTITGAGPSLAIPTAGTYEIGLGCYGFYNSGTFGPGFMSYDIGGTAAVDADATEIAGATSGSAGTYGYDNAARVRVKAFTAVTLTAKYRSGAGATSLGWRNRWMRVQPVTIP